MEFGERGAGVKHERIVEIVREAGFGQAELSHYFPFLKRLVELVEQETKPKRARKAKSSFDAVAYLVNLGVTEAAAVAWVSIRKDTLSEYAISRVMAQVEEAGCTLQNAVDEMVLRGWQSFKAEWVRDKNRFSRTPPKTNEWANELIGRDHARTIDVFDAEAGAARIQAIDR